MRVEIINFEWYWRGYYSWAVPLRGQGFKSPCWPNCYQKEAAKFLFFHWHYYSVKKVILSLKQLSTTTLKLFVLLWKVAIWNENSSCDVDTERNWYQLYIFFLLSTATQALSCSETWYFSKMFYACDFIYFTKCFRCFSLRLDYKFSCIIDQPFLFFN